LPRRAAAFLRYGIPLALTGLAGLLGFQFDRLVVTQRFSPETFAIYAVGAVELPVAVIIQQSVNSVLLPALAACWRDGDVPGLGRLWREAIRKTSLFVLPLFVIAYVLAGDLVRVAFGARYSGSVEIFRIYLLLIPLRVATYGLISMAIGRTTMNLVASLVLLGSNVVLALALVGPLGLKGPAIATVAATVLTVLYYLVRLRGILRLPIRRLFPWRTLGGNLAVAVAAGLPFALLLAAQVPPAARLAIAAPLYSVAYVAAMRAAGRIDDGDWWAARAAVARVAGRRIRRR
jgi:O-antigen/teichoic acid export membrane protein